MWLKKHDLDPDRKQERSNEDTAARVKAVLAQLKGKDYVVLASFKASKGPDHEIRMGSNHAVYCTGKCWQYSKTGTCKHLEYFKANVKTVKFPRIEK
jgi:hypothetical protein